MSFMRGVGKVLAAPVRIMNAPLRAIEHGVAHCVDGRPARDDERSVSLFGEAVARAIEDTAAEMGDG